jgi:ribonuclease P protein component
MDLSLKKAERLRKNSDFLEIYKQAKRLQGRFLLVYFVFNNEERRKAGFVVSKKVSKKAVIRNRAKRRLREIYRTNKHCLPENISVVFTAKPEIIMANYNEIKEDILKLFEKIANFNN